MWGPRTNLFLFDEQVGKANNYIMCKLFHKHLCSGASNLHQARRPIPLNSKKGNKQILSFRYDF